MLWGMSGGLYVFAVNRGRINTPISINNALLLLVLDMQCICCVILEGGQGDKNYPI